MLNEIEIGSNYFNLVKLIYEKSTAKIKLNSDIVTEWKLSKIKKKTKISALTTAVQHCTRDSIEGN